MDEENTRISKLITKYLKGEMTDEEDKELQDWVMQSRENYELVDNLTDPDKLEEGIREFYQSKLNIRKKIDAQIREEEKAAIPEVVEARVIRMGRIKYHHPWSTWKYVATVGVLLLSSGAIWLQLRRSSGIGNAASPARNPSKNDVGPGADKGSLVLADGSAILLDTAANGKLADQGATAIAKDNGGIIYSTGARPQPTVGVVATEGYNTLTTPKAGQFMVTLPDNTKVWLNNASSLRYPTSFHAGKERWVELSGEAYFEVARDVRKPFRVKMNGLTVSVLGTHFNIMAYADEGAVRTTLLEGKIMLSRGGRENLLQPGEQATVSAVGKWEIVKDIDMEGAIAWKNGFFHFDRASLPEVMRQIMRWYDVEIEFRGAVPEHIYGGSIRRDLKLSKVLENLQQNGGHFSIEGRKLVVKP